MTRILAAAALAAAVAAVGLADDKPKEPPKAPAAEKLEAIKKQHKEAEDAFRKAAADLPDTPEGNKKEDELWQAFDKGQGERFTAAFEIAKADPKSDAGFAALEWVLTNPRAYYLPVGKPALEFAAEHYAADPRVGKIAAWVGYYGVRGRPDGDPGLALIKAVADKNPDKNARAQAHLSLAMLAKGKFDGAEYRKEADAEKFAVEAEKVLEALVKEYGDCPRLIREKSGTVGDFAKAELFELRNLRVGKTAPDIDGEDLDGVKFKLSDYRGKVVVIDFWGDW